jgi:hypothetical protein
MIKLLAVLSLLAAGCAAPLSRVPPAGMPEEVAAPAVRAGDAWGYAVHDGYTRIARGTVDYRIAEVTGDTVTVHRTTEGRTGEERYTAGGAWLERPLTNLPDMRFHTPLRALPFPLRPGKKWRETVHAVDPATGRAYRVRVDGRVLGWERVRVPAGEFDALRVERHVYPGNFDHFRSEDRIRETDWYAPRAGLVVRHEGSSEYTDTSVSCRHAACNIMRNDWTVYELRRTERAPGA